VTSTFITQVDPQLQQDRNEETAALLRVLIYKIDNTTFGNEIPEVPQWAGPPRTMAQVEAILYASLAASLFSAFLAMLGKQWLNRYASIDMRGSAIERSQNRQRKLDGIVSWYFHHVMESLPLMLQFALLLLGGALSLYLWRIDTTVAWVVVGITSLGVIFYAFIVIAGTVSVSCPYQTPGAQILRNILPMFRPALSFVAKNSFCILGPVNWWSRIRENWWLALRFEPLGYILALPFLLAHDIYLLVRTMVMGVLTLTRGVRSWFRRVHPPQADGSDRQVVALDLQCVSWILQTSLDKAVHLLTLKSLAAMTTLADFDPAIVSACFDILAGCVAVVGGKAAITQGSEELAATSAACCLRVFSHLTTTNPTSSVLLDVAKQYTGAIPFNTNFENFPAYHSFSALHNVFYPSRRGRSLLSERRPKIQWDDYEISDNENIILVQLARFKYQTGGYRKVPRWILRFALHHLSQDPPPSTSVVVDCLSIVAIDLGCTVLVTHPDERYVRILWTFAFSDKRQVHRWRRFQAL